MNELLSYAADLAEIDPFWWRLQHDSPRAEYDLVQDVVVLDYDEFSLLGQSVHEPSKQGGEASLAFLKHAIEAAMRPAGSPGHLDAIVTAPICKTSWRLAGERRYPGHTELLRAKTGAKRSVMMFESKKLRVALATVHVALMDIRNVLTIGRILDPIQLGHQTLVRMGIRKPKIAVCGLNPHASEDGLFGDEERRLIEPAITVAREQGIDARGPFPADTLFVDAAAGRYDLVVAMYHDQGLIPGETSGFRPGGERHPGPADRPHQRGPRHGLRHRRQELCGRRFHEGGDRPGGETQCAAAFPEPVQKPITLQTMWIPSGPSPGRPDGDRLMAALQGVVRSCHEAE